MFELLALVAVQTTPVLRLPPMAPLPAPPRVEIVAQPGRPDQIIANLFPDLVISEVRVEDDRTAHFKVTNQGTADAKGPIRVTADAYIGTRRGDAPFGSGIGMEDLAMGESKWMAIIGFSPMSEPYYIGKDYSFPLSKATAFTAHVDPPAQSTGGWSDPTAGLGDAFGGGKPKRPRCDTTAGCIRELDETNNHFKAEGDAIARGKPE